MIAPSQVVPRTLQPPAAIENTIVIDDRRSARSATDRGGAAIAIGGAKIEGAFDNLSEVNEAFRAQIAARPVTLDDIIRATATLEDAYRHYGYVLVRVAIPPQELKKDSELRVIVVDGRIEAVDVAGVPAAARAFARDRLVTLIGRPKLKLAALERQLLLASAVPGLTLESTLSTGATDGGVLLTVDGTEKRIAGSVRVDNFLPRSLGNWQTILSASVNNLLGRGETAYTAVGGDPSFGKLLGRRPALSFFGGGISVPLDTLGTNLALDAITSETTTAEGVGIPAFGGRFQRYSGRLTWTPVLSRTERGAFSVGLDSTSQWLSALDFGVEVNRDSYRAARIGLAGEALRGKLRLAGEAQLSFGLTGRDISQVRMGSPNLSRMGASPDFSKLTSRLTADVIKGAWKLSVTARTQTGFGQAMFLSEQFGMDGPDAISAASSGMLQVDSGETLRSEIAYVGQNPVRRDIQPFVFVAQAYGERARPTTVERENASAFSFGGGAQLSIGNVANIGVEVSHAFIYDAVNTDITGARIVLSLRK